MLEKPYSKPKSGQASRAGVAWLAPSVEVDPIDHDVPLLLNLIQITLAFLLLLQCHMILTRRILDIKNRSIIVNLLILPLDFDFDSALALFLLQSSGNVNVHACDVSVVLREQSVNFNLLLFSFVIEILLPHNKLN